MKIVQQVVEKISVEVERKRLTDKLERLNQRKQQLLKKLGQTRQRVTANSRKSDKKFRENRARAVSMRSKKADQAMLRTIDSMIRMTERKLKKLN